MISKNFGDLEQWVTKLGNEIQASGSGSSGCVFVPKTETKRNLVVLFLDGCVCPL